MGIAVGKLYDPDVVNFLNATGITGSAESYAIKRLVSDLKGYYNKDYTTYNLWNKMLALYPFVGGTDTAHKFNLKDPRDLDSAFRLTFTSATHNSGGATITSANTNLIWNNLTTSPDYSRALSFYTPSTLPNSDIISSAAPFNTNVGDRMNIYSGVVTVGTYSGASYTPSTDSGFWLITRTDTAGTSLVKNNALYGTATWAYQTSRSGNYVLTNPHILSGGIQFRFAAISTGLTVSESIFMGNAVQTFQTYLNRQV